MAAERQGLEQEWLLLQQQCEEYERYSLLIKLFSFLLFSAFLLAGELAGKTGTVVLVILLMVWLQDAIWKTFQSRIVPRLLQLEQAIHPLNVGAHVQPDTTAFQFNTHYMQSRPSQIGLIREYALQAIRPTVAFPHALLVFMACVLIVLG